MRIYAVGGQVRDMIMGVEPKDRDYVVVGATPTQMLELGYEQVGSSFPVFLKNGEEYALARTERKVGVGYTGFVVDSDPTITLEQDLLRRDLTINSMAMDLITGDIIDPYGGIADIKRGLLRHTSEAFSEDPVRVLRTARFAARYNFEIAPDTITLMAHVAPELDHVPAERIVTEFVKGMAEPYPTLMTQSLRGCNAHVASAVEPYLRFTQHELRWVEHSSPMYVRMAFLLAGFAEHEYDLCKIPTEHSRVSKSFNNQWQEMEKLDLLPHADALRVFEHLRVFSDPDHHYRVFDVVQHRIKHAAFGDFRHIEWRSAVARLFAAANSIDAAAVAAACASPKEIKQAISNARLDAMRELR